MLTRMIPKIEAAQSVLFLCDVQERFRHLIHKMPTVIHQSAFLYQACTALNVDTIVTEQYPAVMGPTVPEIALQPSAKVFSKTKFSMLTDEVMARLGEDKKQVILCGIESHVCVLQTALDLRDKNYDVFLVCDAVSSQRRYDRKVALQRMQQAGVVLTTTESIVFDLMKDSKHPNFKTVSGLVKAHKIVLDTLEPFED